MDQHAEQPPPSEPRRLGEVDERQRRGGIAKRQTQLRTEPRTCGDRQRVRLQDLHRECIERVRDVGGLRVRGYVVAIRAQKDPPPFPITMMEPAVAAPSRWLDGTRASYARGVVTPIRFRPKGAERTRELGEHEPGAQSARGAVAAASRCSRRTRDRVQAEEDRAPDRPQRPPMIAVTM